MENLSEKERILVGFALFTTSMKIGPSCFSTVYQVVEKIGVREEFEGYANDWIEWATYKKEHPDPQNGNGQN